MSIFCWGNTAHGELGIGGVEEEQVLQPREVAWCEGKNVIQASCGSMHTILLTEAGKLYSCGNNDHGQLGHCLSRKRPQFISALENYTITQTSCGVAHSLAINNWGQLFSWGSNSCGQLGNETTELVQSFPKAVKTLATKNIIQIASGQYHNLALTNNGELYSWGANGYGQLGLGNTCEKIVKPTLIESLKGIPIAFISCGGNHCFALSKSGAVFAWGKNLYGQLGLNHLESRSFPSNLKYMRSLGIRYISCGDDFSVFLTIDGGVFTCGAGTFGQLGHGNTSNEIIPRMVVELMGSQITQIACGKRHTLALVPSRGRVYSFGLGGSGQLGIRTIVNASVPQVVIGPWVSPSGLSLIESRLLINNTLVIKHIFSGGDHCFVLTTEQNKMIKPDDFRYYDPNTQILTLTKELAEQCKNIHQDANVDIDFITTIETIFKSQSCINGSCLLENNKHLCCTSKSHGIDLIECEKIFNILLNINNNCLKQLLFDAITNDLIKTLNKNPPDIETLRIYIILPLYHEFNNSKNYLKLHSPFSEILVNLSDMPLKIVKQWYSQCKKDYYERLVEIFKNVISFQINLQLKRTINDEKLKLQFEKNLSLALETLKFLFRINHQQRLDKVPYDIFYLSDLIERIDIQYDYIHWVLNMQLNGYNFYLCNYPFIFDAQAKTLLLQVDQQYQMNYAMYQAQQQCGLLTMLTGGDMTVSPCILFNVTRENLVIDTIRELSMYSPGDLRKPLKVKFHNEEAEDAGGVRKEFFILILKEILDPKYGMFKHYDDSRCIWFSEDSFEAEEMYTLIGILCGLAIYNFSIINLPFPLALYKKLLIESITINDLEDLSPTLAKSMKYILNYDNSNDDFNEIFDLTFDITREVYGELKTILLKPNGDKISVTQENKQEFVDLYIDFVFNKSVETHFKGFYEGFMRVCGGSRILELFKPHELMAVVVGNEDYDWHELESNTEYKNGYTSSDQIIQWFWEVLHEMPLAEKKKFLLFLTGSDRIPMLGMKAVKIIITPISNTNFLPVAHTCFNLLDLPRYNTKEKLKYKLLQAIQQTQGFSLV